MQDVALDATNTKANALHVYSGDQGHPRCNSLIQLLSKTDRGSSEVARDSSHAKRRLAVCCVLHTKDCLIPLSLPGG
eukprot:5732533-Karenia_brevis.AAC.1